MKLPYVLKLEIERLARLIAAGTLTWDEALDELEPILEKLEYRLFVSELHRRFLRAQLRQWIKSQLAAQADDEESGQQPLPFPDLPPYIEVAVGTRKHQNVMELSDWDAAVRMAEVKAENAAGHVERVRRARDRAYEIEGVGHAETGTE